MDQGQRLTRAETRISTAEGTITSQGSAISSHAHQLNEHTQTLHTLTQAVDGLVDILEAQPAVTPGALVNTQVVNTCQGDCQAKDKANLFTGTVRPASDPNTTLSIVDGVVRARLGALDDQPAATRLKMRLQSVSQVKSADNPLSHCTFHACGEDPVFGKYTPNGHLNFSVINEVAAKLVAGRDYYVDLVLAAPVELAPHQQRVVAEHAELQERNTKLGVFFGTDAYHKLKDSERSRLLRQHQLQTELLEVLSERIRAF
jgi:uncharacterized coiled-coil protein SlyX